MRISVVLASWNGDDFIAEQLASLSRQTRLPDELIVGDDASTDQTVPILEAFAATAPFPVRIIRNGIRAGYAKNFSRLATLASGDILAFCDQDDVWAPRKLEIIESHFAAHPETTCLVHDARIIDATGRLVCKSLLRKLRRSGHDTVIFVKGCATATRKAFAERIFPLPECSAWTHDTILHCVSTVLGSRVVIELPLIDHRLHAENTSGFVPGGRLVPNRVARCLDNFELWSVGGGLRRLPIPRDASESDLLLLERVISLQSSWPVEKCRQIRLQISALRDLVSSRRQAKAMPLGGALGLFRAKWRSGAYDAIGGTRIVLLEWLRIVARVLFRHPIIHDRVSR